MVTMKDVKIFIEIINRITGKVFDVNSTIILSSAQQYAMISLCKKKGKKINKSSIDNKFKIKDVLNNVESINIKQMQNINKSSNNLKEVNVNGNFSVGIDIQNIAEFSRLIDGKKLTKSNFIKDYFTNREIEYSLSRPNTLETICGIYSVKECIRKAGNTNDFKDIEIIHKNGRPLFKDYYISISHSSGVCVAICIKT